MLSLDENGTFEEFSCFFEDFDSSNKMSKSQEGKLTKCEKKARIWVNKWR